MDFLFLVPVALALGVAGLAAFMWSLKSNQYDDLEGAAQRILSDDGDKPIMKARQPGGCGHSIITPWIAPRRR